MLPFPLAGRYNTPISQSKAKIKKERKISMKRLVAIILSLLLLLVQPLALADGTPVSELWARAKATPLEASLAEKQSTLLLQHAMDGMFLNENFDDQFNVLMLAQSLPMLSAIPSADIDAFATAYDLPLRAVEHNYYLSLANALKAEIAMNPSSEEEYRNIQALLELFLTDDDAIIDGVNVGSQQDAARRSITTDQLESIATQYRLPVEFVKGIVLNDDWDDDDWDDDDWDDDRYDDDWDDRYDDYDDYYDDDRYDDYDDYYDDDRYDDYDDYYDDDRYDDYDDYYDDDRYDDDWDDRYDDDRYDDDWDDDDDDDWDDRYDDDWDDDDDDDWDDRYDDDWDDDDDDDDWDDDDWDD